MTLIVYTALRQLTGLYASGATANFEIGITEHSQLRQAVKDTHRSKGGARETLYHRADVTHQLTFEPVNGFRRKQLEEFLASTESGEAFQLFLYGDESYPLTVIRDDDSHGLNRFMSVGSDDSDYMQSSITVMEQ
jgi:hypothetical protein